MFDDIEYNLGDFSKRIEFACCFCGKSGADRGISLVGMDGEFEQQWWCHLDCFLDRMVEPARSSYAAPES